MMPAAAAAGMPFRCPVLGTITLFTFLIMLPAHLQKDPVRKRAKCLAGFGRSIGQGDGLGTAERGDQLLLQDIHVSLITDVVLSSYHKCSLSYLSVGNPCPLPVGELPEYHIVSEREVQPDFAAVCLETMRQCIT